MFQEIVVNGHGTPLMVPQSYQELKTADDQRRARTQEYGVTGVDLWAGMYHEADIAAFRWPGAWKYIDEMVRTNPQIVAVKRMFTQWAGQIKLEWVTAADKPSAIAQERADFANTILDDIQGGSKKLARQIVATVPFNGFQVWEIVPGVRNGNDFQGWRSKYRDGRVGIRKIAIRYLSSHYDWQFEDEESGVWAAWRQQSPRGRLYTIPRYEGNRPRLLHIVFGGDDTNPEGWTPLEAGWRLHKILKGFTFIKGLGHERSAGHVLWTAYQSPNAADKQLMAQSSRAVMTAQEGNHAIELFEKLMMKIVDVPFASAGALQEAIISAKMELLALYDQDWQGMATMTGVGAYEAIRARLVASVDSYNSMMDDFSDQLGQQLYEYLFGMEDRERGFIEEDEIKLTASNIKPPATPGEVAAFVATVWDKLATDKDDQIALRTISGFLKEEMPEVATVLPVQPQTPQPAEDGEPTSRVSSHDEDETEEDEQEEQGRLTMAELGEIRALLAELSDRQAQPLEIAAVVGEALEWAQAEGMV